MISQAYIVECLAKQHERTCPFAGEVIVLPGACVEVLSFDAYFIYNLHVYLSKYHSFIICMFYLSKFHTKQDFVFKYNILQSYLKC